MTQESQLLSVTLFGAPELCVAGQTLAKVRRKNRALVFYLAAHDRPLTRDHLLALFWPDHDRAAAQHILRTMLNDLRKAIGERLCVEDKTLGLASDALVDARTFAAALESPHGRALGEADAGIAYKSDVTEEMAAKITKIEIPDEYNVIAEYPMGILNQSKYPAEAEEFVNLVKSEEGRAVLEKYGFDPV